ncbi:MAG: T9SS type A sorting domain-containing protein [Balneolaceae bacterium]
MGISRYKAYRGFKLAFGKAVLLFLSAFLIFSSTLQAQEKQVLENPILFALVPPPMFTNSTYGHQLETFGNHLTNMRVAPRGGDLAMMDVYGNVRLLTEEAGFGLPSGEVQKENAIAVRQPTIHWDANKAVFSMIIGGPIKAYDITYVQNKWQMYEITNLDQVLLGDTAIIEKIPFQPDYNNISPIYGSDDQIIFTSDAPLYGMEHTYPQLDEYESTPINSGIFKLNPGTGDLVHLTHSPSGDFDLHLASDGRVISTRWEHLKRDQQADAHRAGLTQYGPILFDSERNDAEVINAPEMVDGKPFADADGTPYEVFPEAREDFDPTRDPNEPLHDFNEFLVWEITENGERHQTMNHVGRHEFGGVFQNPSKLDDPNLVYNLGDLSMNANRLTVGSDAGIFQVKEDPRPGKAGTFYGTWSREFSRFSSGRIFEFALPIGANPQEMEIFDWTSILIDSGEENDKGHFRNPLMTLDGTMLVSHTDQTALFSMANPYHFQIKKMIPSETTEYGTEHLPSEALTGAGFEKDIAYYGDFLEPLRDTVMLHEVDLVEIVERKRPAARPEYEIATVEDEVIEEEGVDPEELREWMIEKNLAMIVIRNATERDAGESQQPFNLSVPGGTSTIPTDGKVYDISHFQIFGAELLRAYELRNRNGRRVIATPLRDSDHHPNIEDYNMFDEDGPESSVKIRPDGSIAAFVPATRALSWQTVAPDGEEIVRERQWVTFAPGEIRTCEGCHGINDVSQAGNIAPQNKPQALRDLLKVWKELGGTVSNEDDPETPNTFAVHQNYPNPFNPSTTIGFELPEASNVEIKIFDSKGSLVQTLVNENYRSGNHDIVFNANGYASGMYLYTIKTKFGTQSKRMLLAK